jgi:hypothetical protein
MMNKKTALTAALGTIVVAAAATDLAITSKHDQTLEAPPAIHFALTNLEPPAAFAVVSPSASGPTDSSSVWYSPDGRWLWDSQGIPLYVWTYKTRATSDPDSFIAEPYGSGVLDWNALEMDSLRTMVDSDAYILAVTEFASVFLDLDLTKKLRIAYDPADPSEIDFLILEGQEKIVTIYRLECPGQIETDPPIQLTISAAGDTITLRDSAGNLGSTWGVVSLGDNSCVLRARYDHAAAEVLSWSPSEIIVHITRGLREIEWLFLSLPESGMTLGGYELRP